MLQLGGSKTQLCQLKVKATSKARKKFINVMIVCLWLVLIRYFLCLFVFEVIADKIQIKIHKKQKVQMVIFRRQLKAITVNCINLLAKSFINSFG